MSKYTIKNVAVYLRKSRGDAETDLENHRNTLIDICKKNEWSYTEYAEIGSGDSIEVRPKMQQLLRDVEAETYDAVLVIHYDRLGRGDKVDQARIEKVFSSSKTLIVTPEKVFDLNDDSDMMLADFQGMIARQEYKAISRRLRGGKRRGALAGNWSNGTPPFPYDYNPQTKKIQPNGEKLPIYRLMIEKALQGYTGSDIAWELNSMGILSPKQTKWSPAVVRRLLLDEVHLGKIIAGKKVVKNGVVEYKPKDEWVVVENCHQAVKTQDEHNKILFLFKKKSDVPPHSLSGKHQFSGLIKCGLCGYTMQIRNNGGMSDTIKNCTHRDPFGIRCENRGGKISIIQQHVIMAIETERHKIEEAIKNGVSKSESNSLYQMKESKEKDINVQRKSIDKIYESYEKGIYDDERFVQRRDKAELELRKLQEDLKIIESQIASVEDTSLTDNLNTIKNVIDIIKNSDTTNKEMNRAYQKIIDSIIWTKEVDAPPIVRIRLI